MLACCYIARMEQPEDEEIRQALLATELILRGELSVRRSRDLIHRGQMLVEDLRRTIIKLRAAQLRHDSQPKKPR